MTYQTILTEFVTTRQEIQAGVETIAPQPDPAKQMAQLEAVRGELLETITYLEERHRRLLHQNQQLREAAWSVCSTHRSRYDPQAGSIPDSALALRRLADLIDFPGWHSL